MKKNSKKRFISIITLIMAGVLVCTLLFTGCGKNIDDNELKGNDTSNETETTDETGYPITVTDDYGNEVVITSKPQKIVSLGPAQTEIICALGAMDRLVGRSDSDNYPQEVADIPSIGEYYQPNTELIIQSAPDLVLSTNYMEDDVRTQLNDAGIAVYMIYDGGIDQTENNILKVGQIIGADDEAKALVEELEAKRTEIRELCQSVEEPKAVFVDIGDFYSAGSGSLIGEMLEEINCINIAADGDSAWPQLSLEQVISADPDVYISTFPTEEEIKGMPGMSSVKAFVNGNFYVFGMGTVEGDVIQRSGPRIMEGLEVLARSVYPELFH